MDRARRIWHRGWLRRAITVFSFGYFPLSDGVAYIVTADVECRFVVVGDVAVLLGATVDSEIRTATGVADVGL